MYQFEVADIKTGNPVLDQQINGAFRQLTEQLRFWFQNIDEDNFNDGARIPVTEGGTGGKTPQEARENLGAMAADQIISVDQGGTGGKTQAEAFKNIVSPGGEVAGNLILKNGVGLNARLSNGETKNLIVRHTSDNIWIGSAEGENQGSVYLATKSTGNAYVSRNDERSLIYDRGNVWKTLWSGTAWSVGESKTIEGADGYSVFMVATGANSTPFLLYRNGNAIRGGGFYPSGVKNWINTVAFTISGNTLTYLHSGIHTVSLSSGAIGDLATDSLKLIKFIGVV